MVVVLVGFMGAGKSTVGHILAERLGLPFVDSDVLIEQRTGRTIKTIFAEDGEASFRELERVTIAELLRSQDAVVALGGGALGDPSTRAALRTARVVYLRVSFQEALERVRADEFRPLLHQPDLDQIYAGRLDIYQGAATIEVDTDGRRPDSVALEALEHLLRMPTLPDGIASVAVTAVGGSYYTHIGPGATAYLADALPEASDAERAVLIESRNVPDAAERVAGQLTQLGLGVVRVPVQEGPQCKSLGTFQRVVSNMAAAAIHRTDLVVAIGGESVCDLAGFVASTFNRGMRLVLVPTTLAAQADSSIGGKNGLNLDWGVNLVGSIHQPALVLSDVSLACALPRPEFQGGLAEIAKHALITSTEAVQEVMEYAPGARVADVPSVSHLVVRSVEIKADIVSRDERENGDRVFLNYGHTFAHAMEVQSDMGVSQPAALSTGLMAAALLSVELGRLQPDALAMHESLLEALGLRVRGRFDYRDLHGSWLRDKKFHRGMRFVVLNAIGDPAAGVLASEPTLRTVLDRLASPAG